MEAALGGSFKFGDPERPLLVSVRSGSKFSMPGMMDTVLNLGLNNKTIQGLIRRTGNERFAWDAYRRFIQMFGNVVMGIEKDQFEHIIHEVKKKKKVNLDIDLTAEDLKGMVDKFKAKVKQVDEARFPAGRLGAADHGARRGLRLLEQSPRHHLPQAERHPGQPRHGRERPGHGVRQHGRHVGHGRGLHPRTPRRAPRSSTAST